MDYDRRTAGVSKSIDALKPLVSEAEEAAAAYKRGLAEIEKAYALISKVTQGAARALPQGYYRGEGFHRMGPPREGDAAYAILDYARHLKDELSDTQLSALKKVAPWFDEFVSEMKDNIRLDEEALTKK